MKSYAHLKQSIYSNGKIVENKDIEMNYDGNKMAIDVNNDGKEKHVVLSNEDMIKVFSHPMHANNLMTRLKLDFNKKKTTKKQHKHKKPKTKTHKKKKTKKH